MPGTWDAETTLANSTLDGVPIPTPPPGPSGVLSEKRTWIGVTWNSQSNLAWYQDDAAGKRGIEIDGFPAASSAEWSDDWSVGDPYGSTWVSNLPAAYRDDLASDQLTGQGISAFAIGSANGRALTTSTYYYVHYQTNHGAANSGQVQLRGAAVRHASTDEVANWGYCYTISGWDANSCFFTKASQAVGTYAVGDSGSWTPLANPTTITLTGATYSTNGPYGYGANPPGWDYGDEMKFSVSDPRFGEARTWQVRGPGWKDLLPDTFYEWSEDQRPWFEIYPWGTYEGELVYYDYLSEGFGITRSYEGGDIVWTFTVPPTPGDWGSPFSSPYQLSVNFDFRAEDPSFTPGDLPAPQLTLLP